MSQIKKLDSTLAARIAAGEVIERPQSIVRELMDNAIDAGADEITLSIRGGGIDEIRLSDNGKGIMKEDLPLAVMQYATSKIEKLDDLYHLGTMGFRGEALHSICAVARLSVSSSWNSERPWTLVVDNMKAEPLVPAGPDRGTVVTVENLFSMIPARRNFLKRPQSEGTLCRNTFLAKAMAFENIQFTFYQDGAMKISLPKRRTVFDRVMDILTLDEHFQASDFTYLEKQCPDFSLRLVTSLPSVRRSDRSKIKIYVNKRPVDEFSLVQAVAFGYGEMLPGGSFPYSVLFVEDNPELADFNIHPAKKEVKLRNKAEIHHEIHRLIASGLPRQIPVIKARPESQQPLLQDVTKTTVSWQDPALSQDRIRYAAGAQDKDSDGRQASQVSYKPKDRDWFEKAKELLDRTREEKNWQPAGAAQADIWTPQKPSFRYIGQAFNLFLICQKDDALYLVDQHAAHERIIFNELKKQKDIQKLLIPIEFEVDADVDAFLCENAYIYTQYGIALSQKDDKLWELTSVPTMARDNEKKLVSFIQNAVGSEDEIESGLEEKELRFMVGRTR